MKLSSLLEPWVVNELVYFQPGLKLATAGKKDRRTPLEPKESLQHRRSIQTVRCYEVSGGIASLVWRGTRFELQTVWE